MYTKHDTGWHTTSQELHGPFKAMWQGVGDGLQPVEDNYHPQYGHMMIIGSDDGVTYITKLQAMKFFGLEDPSNQAQILDTQAAEK
jgi:hypothetical protein